MKTLTHTHTHRVREGKREIERGRTHSVIFHTLWSRTAVSAKETVNIWSKCTCCTFLVAREPERHFHLHFSRLSSKFLKMGEHIHWITGICSKLSHSQVTPLLPLTFVVFINAFNLKLHWEMISYDMRSLFNLNIKCLFLMTKICSYPEHIFVTFFQDSLFHHAVILPFPFQ